MNSRISNYLMKCLIASVFVLLFSCTNTKTRHFTAEVEFTCTPTLYFDTLSTFLLTNNKSDLGGETSGQESLFSAERVYKKYVVKKNGHFYIDNIENSEYWLLLVECNLDNTGYIGYMRNVDFSNNSLDTLNIKICVEPNMRQIISE